MSGLPVKPIKSESLGVESWALEYLKSSLGDANVQLALTTAGYEGYRGEKLESSSQVRVKREVLQAALEKGTLDAQLACLVWQ